MVLTVKHKYSYYRRFELDIWGSFFTSGSSTQEDIFKDWRFRFFFKIFLEWRERYYKRMRRYIYRVDIIEKFSFKRKYEKRFLSVRLTRLYFLTFQDYQFRKLFKLSGKMDGNLEENYLYFLEGRLLSIIYRMNFIFDIFECMRAIKDNTIYLNFKVTNNINKRVNIGDFISLKWKDRKFILYNCEWRLEQEAILFNIPRFLFVSYYFLFSFLLCKPNKKDLVYPFTLDIQRISGYF